MKILLLFIIDEIYFLVTRLLNFIYHSAVNTGSAWKIHWVDLSSPVWWACEQVGGSNLTQLNFFPVVEQRLPAEAPTSLRGTTRLCGWLKGRPFVPQRFVGVSVKLKIRYDGALAGHNWGNDDERLIFLIHILFPARLPIHPATHPPTTSQEQKRLKKLSPIHRRPFTTTLRLLLAKFRP